MTRAVRESSKRPDLVGDRRGYARDLTGFGGKRALGTPRLEAGLT